MATDPAILKAPALMDGIVGKTASSVMMYLLAIAAFPPACFSSFIAANSFKTTLPKVNPSISCGIGILAAIVLALSGWAGNAAGVFTIIGASFGPVCGAMAADYLLAGRKWAGPRRIQSGWLDLLGPRFRRWGSRFHPRHGQSAMSAGGCLCGRVRAVFDSGIRRPAKQNAGNARNRSVGGSPANLSDLHEPPGRPVGSFFRIGAIDPRRTASASCRAASSPDSVRADRHWCRLANSTGLGFCAGHPVPDNTLWTTRSSRGTHRR